MKIPTPTLAVRALACLLAAGATLAPLNAAELLAEYDFETIPAHLPNWGAGLGRVYKPATGWKKPFLVTLDSANPHSGAKAVTITYNEAAQGDKIFHSCSVPVPENPSNEARRVRIRFFYRLTGLPEKTVTFAVLELNPQTKSKRFLDNKKALGTLEPSEQWRSAEYLGNLDSGTRQLQLIWVNPSESVPAALSLDDIAVELVPPEN